MPEDVTIELARGVMTLFDGSAFSNALGGRMSAEGQVREGEKFPYSTFDINISNVRSATFTEELETFVVQIDIFSASADPNQFKTLYGLQKDLYNEDSALVVLGYTVLWMRRISAREVPEDFISKSGFKAMHWSTDYEVYLRKN